MTTPAMNDDDTDQNFSLSPDTDKFMKQPDDGPIQATSTVYLDFTGTIQTILCSIIGFGIISLPYSVKLAGCMAISVCTNLVCAAIVLLSTIVYLMVRNNMQKLYF